MLALPIFPASHPASIVGEGVLNFCVREGNRWTHTPINTNYICFGFYRAFILYHMDFSLSRRNLVTHTGFEPMLTA